MQTKKKAAIHERKILTDRQLFSLKLLCLRCGQNFIIDQLIGLIKCFDHLGRFRMEIDFIQRFGFGRVPDSAFQDILVDACAVTKAGVGMAGGVGRIGGELPGKLRLALTIFVVTDSTELQKIAVHEAAHAVVGEVLHPGSIGIVTVRGSQGVIGGMVNGCATYAQNEEEFLDEVTKTLAGRAGVSLIYGVMDIQASADIEQADKLMDIWLCYFAGGGFAGTESGDNRMSEQRLSYNEAIKSAKLEELYRRAYKILHNNKYFLLAVQHGLLEHETLLNSDLAKIRESCI